MPEQGFGDLRVLITGGASGLGRACAGALTARGARVAIGDVDAQRANEAAAAIGGNAVAIPLDVSSASSVAAGVKAAREALGGIDGVVNSAGIIRITPLAEVSDREWDQVLDVDLKGVFLTCQAAAPFLCRSGRGRIVNIASDAAHLGFPMLSHYSAAKGGVIALGRSIAAELACHGVTVNTVCPAGTPDTEMGAYCLRWKMEKTGATEAEVRAAAAEDVPLKRNCEPADVVNAVLFFLSSESSFITGQVLYVDGGLTTLRSLPATSGAT